MKDNETIHPDLTKPQHRNIATSETKPSITCPLCLTKPFNLMPTDTISVFVCVTCHCPFEARKNKRPVCLIVDEWIPITTEWIKQGGMASYGYGFTEGSQKSRIDLSEKTAFLAFLRKHSKRLPESYKTWPRGSDQRFHPIL